MSAVDATLAETRFIPGEQDNTRVPKLRRLLEHLIAAEEVTLDAVIATLAGSGTLNLTGGQIAFPAVQNPSSDPHTLDDYEEGTFTPSITIGGASTGITYSVQLGRYTKIGRVVFVALQVTLTSKGALTGNVAVAGLPFASSPTPANQLVTRVNNVAGFTVPMANVAVSATTCSISNFNGAVLASVTDANFTNTSVINLTGFYTTP